MFLEEMRDLPRQCPQLETWGFWIAGFNRAVDWVITPVVALSMALSQELFARRMGRLLLWGLERFSKPPYGTVMTARVVGESDGRNHTISARLMHADMYWFTAIPAFACLLQYLDGTIRKPGLWLQGTAVDPDRLMADLGRLGVQVEASELPTNRPDARVSV
jgi:saccharopine dehydrogenase (NAD+, L-lysine-forming)